MKKIIIITVISIIVAGAVAYYIFSKNKKTAPVWKTAKVEKGSIIVTVTATGTLNPDTTVQVGAQVSGIVSQIYVDFDSTVRKGQLIARLDTTLEHATLIQSQAAVENADAQLALQKMVFNRLDTLYHQNVTDKNDYDQAYANLKVAEANLKSAKANYAHDKINLGYATIYAPVNGIVISRNVDVGQTVISSFNAPNLFSIAIDLRRMQDLADVDEADIGQVKAGQEAAFTVDAYPYDVFKGTVGQIRLQPVMIQNVNNYIVVINFKNPDLKLLPGLTATTTIKTQQHDSILKVLVNAVHFIPPADYLKSINFPDSSYQTILAKKVAGNEIPRPGDMCYIWIKHDGIISPELVTAGLFDGTDIEVSGNIKDGDEVVTGGGAVQGQQMAAPTANNPFMPQMHTQAKKK